MIHTSPFQLHTSALRRSLPWPALAGAPRAAGFAARILGYGHRSSFGDSTSIASIELVRCASRVGVGPLPCPAPSDAIRAPRPSFRRSSMPAVPSASSSFPVANRDILSAANRIPSRWNVHSGSAGRGDSFASATSIRPAVHPAKIAAASCRRRVNARASSQRTRTI